jgi:hypothetical protein
MRGNTADAAYALGVAVGEELRHRGGPDFFHATD